MLEEYLIRSRTRDGLFVVAMTAIFFDTNKLFRAGKKKLSIKYVLVEKIHMKKVFHYVV